MSILKLLSELIFSLALFYIVTVSWWKLKRDFQVPEENVDEANYDDPKEKKTSLKNSCEGRIIEADHSLHKYNIELMIQSQVRTKKSLKYVDHFQRQFERRVF